MENNHVRELLTTIPFFKGLSKSHIKSLEHASVIKLFRSGHMLFLCGDPANCLYVLLEGEVSVENMSLNGRVTVLSTLSSGDVIGELALLDGGERSASVRVLQPSKLLVIKRRVFLDVISDDTAFLLSLIKTIIQRLRRTNQQIEYFVSQSLQDRLVIFLLGQCSHENDICSLSQKEIAERLSASREKINICLKALKDKNYISTGRRQIKIINREALETYIHHIA